MNSRSTGDLSKIYRYSDDITKSRGRMFMMLYHEQNRGTTADKKRSSRIESLRVRVNRLTLMRHDEIMRVYSNVVLTRNMSPLPRRRRRRTRSTKRKQRSTTVPEKRPSARSPSVALTRSSSSTSGSPSRSRSPTPPSLSKPVTPPRTPSPIVPLKVAHVVIKPDVTVIDMVPPSFKPDPEIDDEDDTDDTEEEDDDIIYPEDVIDRRPYKTVARFRKAIGKSTNFREHPLLVGDDSTETLILGLENFAQEHGCDLSFTDEAQQFDRSIYRAAAGIIDLGSIHLLATDALLTANFQFEIDLDYDSEISQSKANVEHFVLDFCEAISKVLSCDNDKVRVFSIDKLAKKSGTSHVNFGLTTSDRKKTEQLARTLQKHARSGFTNDTILKHVKPKEYECTWKPVLKHLQIRATDLAPEHNYDYRQPYVPKQLTRGNRPYYLPIDWYRHALNVENKYEDGPLWLGCVNVEGEWPVAFHGTHAGAVSSIAQDGLLVSTARTDAMMQEAVQQMGEEANRPGLYVATHCNGGSYPRYTTPFPVTTFPGKSEHFSIVFQCRVQPNKFTTHTSPVTVGEAWRIVDPKAVRPYGILLKKEASTKPDEET